MLAPKVILASLLLPSGAAMAADKPPRGVEMLLPRGGIPAVLDPEFVSGAEAEIPAEAWVFGVVVDGFSRAYSLNLLNRHEIVNDTVGDKSFAAVW